jgi:hypothetical protein
MEPRLVTYVVLSRLRIGTFIRFGSLKVISQLDDWMGLILVQYIIDIHYAKYIAPDVFARNTKVNPENPGKWTT